MLASSIYGTGVALGSALASLSLLLDSKLGWSNALVVIGIFGFGAAALNTLLLPDDQKENILGIGSVNQNKGIKSSTTDVRASVRA